ncbi:MAG: sugar ABC transporter substrate-binding protein [Caldilineaceae bacterium]|nr:sugar ABC transporter substrate-binding protein [Caldilineaceae bacterium]
MQVQQSKLSRRTFLQMATATAAPLILAACAPTAAPATSAGGEAAAPSGEKVAIRYIGMDYDSRMQADTQALFDEFNASQGEIEGQVEIVGWPNGHNLLLTQISAGQAPDIFNGGGGWLLEFQSAGTIAALTDLLPADLLDKFWPSGIQAMTVGGTLYGMPYFLDPRGLYFRKDLFEEAGLSAPETWADVREAAKALHNPPSVYGIGLEKGDCWWYAWIGAIGAGNNLSRWTEDGKSRIADPEGIAAVQFLADLVLTDDVAQPSPASANRDADLQPLFLAGQCGILETGSWFPTIINNDAPDLQFDLAQLPVSDASLEHANVFWPDCVMMAEQSKNKEAAGTVLEFMFNFENRLKWALQRGVIPERTDVGADPRYLDPNSPITPFNEFYVKEVATAHNVFETPWPATGEADSTTLDDAMTKIWLGEMSVEEALIEAAQIIDERHGVA